MRLSREVLVFALLCLIWGTSWAVIKLSLLGVPPFLGAAARFAVAAVALYLMARLGGLSLRLPPRVRPILMLAAFLNFTVDYGLIYWAEQTLSAGVTAIFFATFPIFTALYSGFLFRTESATAGGYAGLALGFLGVLLTFHQELARTDFNLVRALASAAVVVSAAAGAMGVVLVKRYLQGIHPVTLTLHQIVWGIMGLTLIGLLRGERTPLGTHAASWAAIVYLGMGATAAAFTLYYWLLQRVTALTVSLVIFITPVLALVVDWVLLGEKVGLSALAGMLLIFSGVALTGNFFTVPSTVSVEKE